MTITTKRSIDVHRCQVTRLTEVAKHPKADKLLVAKADIGGETRQLVAGLAQHYQPAELEGRLVVAISNLKPAKLVGIESQVMLFAATDRQSGKVQVLVPPEGSQPGDRIFLEGSAPVEGSLSVIDKKHWEAIVPGLIVKGLLF